MTNLLDFLEHLIREYGYGIIGCVVMLESMGLPLPAESLIIASSLYAASTHHLGIHWIALAAIIGAIMGDNFGYLIGRAVGFPLLIKHGSKIGLTPKRLLLGRYLFQRHGGIVVFFGRFVVILRLFSALLAGANHMNWRFFLVYNALGGIAWAGGYAAATYVLGKGILNLSGPLALSIGGVFLIVALIIFFLLKRNEKRFMQAAMEAAHHDPYLPKDGEWAELKKLAAEKQPS